MPRPIKELTDMEIDEISLVDRPANAHAKVVITKRDEEAVVPEDVFDESGEIVDADTLSEGDVVFDDGGQAFVVVSDEYETDEVEVGKSAVAVEEDEEVVFTDEEAALLEELTGKAFEEITAEDLQDIEFEDVEKIAAPAIGIPKVSNIGAAAKDAGSRFKHGFKFGSAGKPTPFQPGSGKAGKIGEHLGSNKTAYGIGGATAGATGLGGAGYLANERNKVAKSFSEELREELSKSHTDMERDEVIAKAMGQVEEMAVSLQEAEDIAKSERDLRLHREYEEVAKNYNLPVDPSELAPVLQAIGEQFPYEYGAIIHKALSSVGEILFEEIGSQGASDNNDVLRTVDAFIEENVSKADISKAAAVSAVFTDNPDAYDEYMATRYGS